MNSILVVAGALALMIIVHEFGHLVAARLCGISVASFAVGFGKRLYTIKIGLIDYSLRLIPLGGFVSLCGMTEDTKHEQEKLLKEGRTKEEVATLFQPAKLYVNAPWWKQVIAITAGCFMNVVVGLLLYTTLLLWKGSDEPTTITVDHVNSAVTQTAGLQPQDVVVACNGISVATYSDLRFALHIKPESTDVVVKRANQIVAIHIPPRESSYEGLLGIQIRSEHRTFTVTSAFTEACRQSVLGARSTLRVLFSRYVVKALRSPVGLVDGLHKSGFDQISAIEALESFLRLTWAIGISLAVANLLPLPILDGGHLIFALAKLCRRGKEVPVGIKQALGGAFIVVLLFLQVFIVVRDIVGIFK